MSAPRKAKAAASLTTAQLIARAVEQNADIAHLRELIALQRDEETRAAQRAYDAAMIEFKAEAPRIEKDRRATHQGDFGPVEYMHATIGNVVATITAALARHGFTHRWTPSQGGGDRIAITCVLRHRDGHFESSTLESPPDDSGGKNGVQAISSAATYLERLTLLAVTGMATIDQADDDGRGTDQAAPGVSYPPEHAELVNALGTAAAQGIEALHAVWADTTPQQRTAVSGAFREFKKRAEAVG